MHLWLVDDDRRELRLVAESGPAPGSAASGSSRGSGWGKASPARWPGPGGRSCSARSATRAASPTAPGCSTRASSPSPACRSPAPIGCSASCASSRGGAVTSPATRWTSCGRSPATRRWRSRAPPCSRRRPAGCAGWRRCARSSTSTRAARPGLAPRPHRATGDRAAGRGLGDGVPPRRERREPPASRLLQSAAQAPRGGGRGGSGRSDRAAARGDDRQRLPALAVRDRAVPRHRRRRPGPAAAGRGERLGVILVRRSAPDQPFVEADLVQLGDFAIQAAIALENVRLLRRRPPGPSGSRPPPRSGGCSPRPSTPTRSWTSSRRSAARSSGPTASASSGSTATAACITPGASGSDPSSCASTRWPSGRAWWGAPPSSAARSRRWTS